MGSFKIKLGAAHILWFRSLILKVSMVLMLSNEAGNLLYVHQLCSCGRGPSSHFDLITTWYGIYNQNASFNRDLYNCAYQAESSILKSRGVPGENLTVDKIWSAFKM